MYPYRIRITDPKEIKIYRIVSNQRFLNDIEPKMIRSIGHKIPKKIKRDGVIVKDRTFAICNPKISLSFAPSYGKRKGFDFLFKSLF